MCELCDGTGGVTIQHSWGLENHACKHPQCDYDREQAIRDQAATIQKMKAEIYERQADVS